MTIYDLKPKFQALLRPLVKLIHSCKITPNQLTVFTCLLSMCFSALLYNNVYEYLLFVPFFFFIRMALNALDGMLANEYNLQSDLGAILNELTDIVSDGALYLAFMAHPLIEDNWVYIFITGAFLSEYVGVSGLLTKKKTRSFKGPLGKSDRAFFMSLLALLLSMTTLKQNFYCFYFWGLYVLSAFTILNRVRSCLR